MSKVLSQLVVLLAVLVAAAALGWEPSAVARVTHATHQSGASGMLGGDDATFEDDDEDDDDDLLESGLPAPNGNDDEGDADADAAPLDAIASSAHSDGFPRTEPAFLSPAGIRPSGGHRPTSDRPPRV